jgi:hypothetical protein
MRNVLIVDDDVGFVCWLGGALINADADYQPWPACSVHDAISLVGRKPMVPLDLLIVNPNLPEASYLIALYRGHQPNLKVMALGSYEEAPIAGIRAWHDRPKPGDRSARKEWVQEIERVAGGKETVRHSNSKPARQKTVAARGSQLSA